MIEAEELDRTIGELKKVQRLAWRHLARSSLPAFERCELRNQMKHCDAELRHRLQIKSERFRFDASSVEEASDSLANLKFWLLNSG